MENKDNNNKYAGLPHRIGIIEDYAEGIWGDAGVISIVFEGAIEQEFKMYSNKNLKQFAPAQVIEDKRIITGPAMRADYKILQQDFWTGEYYTISYSADQIQKFMKLFSKNGYNRMSNLQHHAIAEDGNWGYSFETWQVLDVNNDKSNVLGFTDVNVGDMYVSYFIENPEMWNSIKAMGFKGFSIEAMVAEKLAYANAKVSEKDVENKIKEIAYSEVFSDKYKEEMIKKVLFMYSNLNKAK